MSGTTVECLDAVPVRRAYQIRCPIFHPIPSFMRAPTAIRPSRSRSASGRSRSGPDATRCASGSISTTPSSPMTRCFAPRQSAQGLIECGFDGSKQAVRDAIRLLPDGELAWQKLQGQVYGKGIADAGLLDGVEASFAAAARRVRSVFIVSHKTEFGHYDPDAHQSATGRARLDGGARLLRQDGYGLRRTMSSSKARAPKSSRASGALDCTHFIDDLEEVLERSRLSGRGEAHSVVRTGKAAAGRALHRLSDLARHRGACFLRRS